MSNQFIPLGFNCNITFVAQDIKLKHETSVFEWLQSHRLQYLADIVHTMKDGIDTSIITGKDHDVHVLHNDVYTFHYTLEEYKVIFERRGRRFLDTVKNSAELLFVRINPNSYYTTTEEEINNFCEQIHAINPSLHIKFLIIHTVEDLSTYTPLDESKICNITFMQREFLKEDCPDEYLNKNPVIQQKFLEYLEDLGVDTTLTSDIQFDDRT